MTPDLQRFLDQTNTFQFFEHGRMDVEHHCVYLSLCLNCDGDAPVPQPRDILDLLVQIAQSTKEPGAEASLMRQPFKVGETIDTDVHPDGYRTVLQVGKAMLMFEEYVFQLGRMLGIEPAEDELKPGYWIRPEWVFTCAFVDRFVQCIVGFMRYADRRLGHEWGYSPSSSQRMSQFDPNAPADELLAGHVTRHKTQFMRAQVAIGRSAYVEAIVLAEQMVSGQLRHMLEFRNIDCARYSLAQLIETARHVQAPEGGDNTPDLWNRLDTWRQRRNRSMHGEHRSLMKQAPSLDHQPDVDRRTAQSGLQLVTKVTKRCIDLNLVPFDGSSYRVKAVRRTH